MISLSFILIICLIVILISVLIFINIRTSKIPPTVSLKSTDEIKSQISKLTPSAKAYRNVFTYWTGNSYKLITMLFDIMKEVSQKDKGFNFYLLNSETCHQFVNLPHYFDQLIPSHQSDILRCKIINKYGGIWIDADTLILEDLEPFFDIINSDEKEGFFVLENNEVLTSGFFGSKPNTQVLNNWENALNKIITQLEFQKDLKNIDWLFFIDSLRKQKQLAYQTYFIMNGLDTIYPLNWDKQDVYLEAGYDINKIKRPFQPVLILVNSVYKKVETEGIPRNSPLEHFLCYNLKWDFVDKLIYINLDERNDRRQDITNTLSLCMPKHKFIRFSAIKDKIGHIGCSKSHIECLKIAIKNNWKNVIITEDDITWYNLLEGYTKLQNYIKNNPNYQVIILGGACVKVNNNFRVLHSTAATAYLVNSNYYQTLLQNFETGLYQLEKTHDFPKYCIDQYWQLLQRKDNWYIIHPALIIQKPNFSTTSNSDIDITELQNIDDNHVSFVTEYFGNNKIKPNLFCFWTGYNPMSDQRKACLETMHKSGFQVMLITPANLDKHLVEPLHEGFQYLSEVHKADYLRCYFMHFYGGGYSDIKTISDSWMDCYRKLMSSSTKYIAGYKEVGPHEVAKCKNLNLYKELQDNWELLIGNCAFICKPQTVFTYDWYNTLLNQMDINLKQLKKYPARTTMEVFSEEYHYPFQWSDIMGGIFHPVVYKYKDHVINSLPPPKFKNYR